MEREQRQMENMGLENLFSGIYNKRKVLITGHTGFKGSWLAFWLKEMNADILGYSLEPPTEPNHYNLLKLDIRSVTGNILDTDKLFRTFIEFQPEIVFHLAAQPLVRFSYEDPLLTFNTNIIGTANVLEACRKTGSVKAVINITSDKCYENREWVYGYRENDPVGGHDPYSASKGCSELVTSSFRNSFFNPKDFEKSHHVLLASARAGNVIGGGDWAADRLVPDIIRSVSRNVPVRVRNPLAVRPWQHVLEPLSGYLLLGKHLLEKDINCAGAWNFGPGDKNNVSVIKLVEKIQSYWPVLKYEKNTGTDQFHEAEVLKLDCSKAFSKLKWYSTWEFEQAIEKTTNWYKCLYEKNNILTRSDLLEFVNDSKKKGMNWAE